MFVGKFQAPHHEQRKDEDADVANHYVVLSTGGRLEAQGEAITVHARAGDEN